MMFENSKKNVFFEASMCGFFYVKNWTKYHEKLSLLDFFSKKKENQEYFPQSLRLQTDEKRFPHWKNFSLFLLPNPLSKNSTLLTPNLSQFSKQGLEKLPQKNNRESREHVLGVRGLRFQIWNLRTRVEKTDLKLALFLVLIPFKNFKKKFLLTFFSFLLQKWWDFKRFYFFLYHELFVFIQKTFSFRGQHSEDWNRKFFQEKILQRKPFPKFFEFKDCQNFNSKPRKTNWKTSQCKIFLDILSLLCTQKFLKREGGLRRVIFILS